MLPKHMGGGASQSPTFRDISGYNIHDIPSVKSDGGEWNTCFHAVNEWPPLLLPRIDNGGLVPSDAFAVSGQE